MASSQDIADADVVLRETNDVENHYAYEVLKWRGWTKDVDPVHISTLRGLYELTEQLRAYWKRRNCTILFLRYGENREMHRVDKPYNA